MTRNIGRMGLNSKDDVHAQGKQAIVVSNRLRIPPREYTIAFSRSSGPGGQNVNKTSTRVEVRFNIRSSNVLSETQKQILSETLAHRIDGQGSLRVVEQRSRSQAGNRELALKKLGELLRKGLKKTPKRVPTRPTRSSQELRMLGKRRKSETKRLRRRIDE
jgi:ribosome-associated protein